MDVRRSRTCEKCKTSVPLNEVRLYPRDRERNWILCGPCCDYLKNRASTDVKKPVTNQPKPVSTPLPLSKSSSSIVRNVCTVVTSKEPKVSEIPLKKTGLGASIVIKPSSPVKNSISVKNPGEKSLVEPQPVLSKKSSGKAGEKSGYSKEDMFCGRCKYSFSIDPSRVGVYSKLTCPYCGKIDQIYDRKSGAQIKEEAPTMMKSLLYKRP